MTFTHNLSSQPADLLGPSVICASNESILLRVEFWGNVPFMELIKLVLNMHILSLFGLEQKNANIEYYLTLQFLLPARTRPDAEPSGCFLALSSLRCEVTAP